MALEYNIKATMNITNQNVDMNMVDQDFESSSYDMLLYGFGNFISGNLQVDASDQDKFKSNVTVDTTALGNLKLLYVDKNGITIKTGKLSEIPSNKEKIINTTNLVMLPLLPILQRSREWFIK